MFELVNAAYAVESGDTGVAFKNTTRFISLEEAAETLPNLEVACRGDAAGEIVGCACTEVVDAGSVEAIGDPKSASYGRTKGDRYGFLGPIAISPSAQGSGLGSWLLQASEDKARRLGASWMEITVVNHRTDLRPFYEKRGYVFHHSIAFVDVERLTRESWFNVFRKRLV